MSFVSLLTPERLRSLAGYSYERGMRYFREGRVVSCVPIGDAVQGVVSGTEDYDVRIYRAGRSIASSCTCPVGGTMCKHAVALALAHVALNEVDAREVPVTGAMFATRPELEAWAKAHQVEHELAMSAETLLPELAPLYGSGFELRHLLLRLSLREIGSVEGAGRYLGMRRLVKPAAAAVARRLERAAEEVREGIAEEARMVNHAALVAAAPNDTVAGSVTEPDAIRRLRGKLVAFRAIVRAQTVPRARAARPGTLGFELSANALSWREARKVTLVEQTFVAAPIEARLRVTPSCVLTCVCTEPACTHGLALIDEALALLADPARTHDAQRIAEELLRPAWERALAELARHEELATKARPQIEVWWQIEHQLRTLTITPIVKKQLKKGGFSGGARMAVDKLLADHGAILAEQDLRIAEYLVTWLPGRQASTYPARAFAALVGHPRVVLEDTPETRVSVIRVPLGFTALAADDQIRLEPSVDGGRFSPRLLSPLLRAFAPGEPLVVLEPEHERCVLIEVSDEARQLWGVLEKHGDVFPPESHPQLLERLARLEPKLPLAIPHALKGTRVDESLVVVVRLRLLPDTTLELEAFVRPAPGAPLYPPSAGPRDVMILRNGERAYVRRDLDRELEQVRSLLARLPLDAAIEGPTLCFRIEDTDAALTLVAAVQQPPPGLEAEWIDLSPRIISSGGPKGLRVEVEKKRDWFGLVGELRIEEGRLELAVLLDAARRQQRFVRLDEHRWVELTEALRARLVAVSDQTFVNKQQLELSPGAVPAIRELAEAGAKVDTAPAWQTLTDRLAASMRLRPRPPATLTATLRPYQVEGHAWLSRLATWGAGGCLADDMGLGKTVQAIALLLDRARLGPALVLAPTSVTLNWVDELRRFAPSLNPVVYGEQTDRAGCVANLGKKDILIASYGLLVRDAELLASRSFATLVIDEAQALKNPTTHRAKAARALDAQFRIALSGTPLENHLGELWSLFSIVFPGLLGSWDQFRNRFATPIEKGKDPEARAALSRVIRPFLLRRTKGEVARELPSRTEIQVPIVLSSEETVLYEDARLAAVAELSRRAKGMRDERRRFQVLAALTRLRLLASHPRLYDATSSVASSKMQRLRELLDELKREGHRALVFSQFTSHLALVRTELAGAGFHALYLDGSTPTAERASLIARFQGGEGDVFLISLKAGGTGINLTAADYVIHLDPWWNPAVEDQATDRAHRIGQTKPVTVYRLIARGTVEEQIVAMHHDKRALVAGVLDGTDVAARLTTRDLLALLGQGGVAQDSATS